jgi:hypothetical protein
MKVAAHKRNREMAGTQTVHVYSSPIEKKVLTETDLLDGGNVLPGFVIAIREIFG